jgi:hypothetical protein
MHLTKGWIITIIGLLLGIAGLSFEGINVTFRFWVGNNSFFSIFVSAGLIIMVVGSVIRRRERELKSQKASGGKP